MVCLRLARSCRGKWLFHWDKATHPDGGKRLNLTVNQAKCWLSVWEACDYTEGNLLRPGIPNPKPMECTNQTGVPHLIHNTFDHPLDNPNSLEVEPGIQQIEFRRPAHMKSGLIHCLGSKPFRLQGASVLSGRLHIQKSRSFCSLLLSRNVHSTCPSEVNRTMPLMDAGSFELSFGVAKDLRQRIDAAALQKESELCLSDLKKEFDRDERPIFAANCLVLPNHLRHRSTEFLHTQDHKHMKRIPKYLSSRDIMLAKKELLDRDWIRLRDQIISSRIYVVENMQSTFSNIEKLHYDYGVKGPSDGLDIYKGECDAAFDGKDTATLAFIIWRDDKVIWAEIIRGFSCSSAQEAEACAALALVWKAQELREITNLSIYTDSLPTHGILSGSLTIKQNDKKFGLYMLLRGTRVHFDKFISQWKPRDLLFLPNALASSQNIDFGPLLLGTTLKNFTYHLSGLPIFKVSPSTKAKEITSNFVVKPYNEPVESTFYLVVEDKEKIKALTAVTESLKPRVAYAAIHNIEHKHSYLQKHYDDFIPTQIGEFTDIYFVNSRHEPKDTDNTDPQGVRSIIFVFDATTTEASYAHLNAFTIFLVSPKERVVMRKRGIKELNALSYIYYHGVIEDQVLNLSTEGEKKGGEESGEEVLAVSLSHPKFWWGPDLSFPRREDILNMKSRN